MKFNVIPAIDIKDGKCTQLVGGVASTAKYYGDPVEVAKKWVSLGAEILHVIDLDATLGTGSNIEIVRKIKDAVDVPIQFGGGVRSYDFCHQVLHEYEIDRVFLGTLAVNDYLKAASAEKTELAKLPKNIRERIVVSLDSKGGKVVTHGWQTGTMLDPAVLAKAFEKTGVWGFLYTDVDVEGQMKGINVERTKKVIDATKKPVIASGGVSSLEDIKKLKDAGAWGVVLGKALYEGKIDYKEAVKC